MPQENAAPTPQNPTPTPPAVPVTPTDSRAAESSAAPAADAAPLSIDAERAAWNARVEAETGQRLNEDVADGEEISEIPAETVEGETALETKKADAPEEGETTAEDFAFTPDADAETFEAESAAYLETVELTPQLQTILDRRNAEINRLRASGLNNEATPAIKEVAESFGKIYETAMNGDEITANVKPAVDAIRAHYKNEYPQFTREILESDSTKYEGVTVFVERLMDDFGASPQQIQNVAAYLKNPAINLPVPPPPVPEGVDPKLADAFGEVGETKRYEIQEILIEIDTLKKDFEAADGDFYKQTIKEQLDTLQSKLNGEISIVQKIQHGIDADRSQKQTAARQAVERAQAFDRKTTEAYNNEIFSIAENFAKDLAPRLSFVEGDAAIALARDILARTNNALSFEVDNEMNLLANPMADFYAKQLKDEGVDFDFKKGRELLHRHMKATRHLALLEERRESPAAIEYARRNLNRTLKDIKVEQQQLLGQISQKYVKGANGALSKKVADLEKAKQKTRAVIAKNSPTLPKKADTLESIEAERRAYNARVAEAINNGDDLYGAYNS